MKYNLQTRRMFLQGMGRMLPMPFLVSLLPRQLWAQTAGTGIKRFIQVTAPYDYGRHSNWYPSLNQPAQTLNANGETVRYQALTSYLANSSSPLSTIFGNSLNPYLNRMNLLRGMDLSTRIAHGRGHIVGNFAANDGHDSESVKLSQLRTMDQVVRGNARFNPNNRDVVVMGNETRSYRRDANGTISLAQPVGNTPREVFNYLFDNGNLPESGGTTTTTRHPRYDRLTEVMEDYRRVRGGTQISAADRVTLDNALDLIADVQRGLAGTQTTTGACTYKNIPTAGNGQSYYNNNLTLKAYADMISAAIMCDVARVFSFSSYLDEGAYDVNPNDDFHQGHSHVPFTVINGKINWQYMGEIHAIFVRNFLAPLLANLEGATDPSNSRSYLYNSLLTYQLECGQVHGLNSQPFMTAGNAAGGMTSGYYLDYTDRARNHAWVADSFVNTVGDERFANEYVGVPLNRAFNTVFQSLGLTPAEYEIAGLNPHFENRTDSRYGAINNNLARLGGYGHWGPATSNYGADYISRQPLYNLQKFKDVLPMPNVSAG